MTKSFKRVKAGIIMSIFLFSVIAAIAPTSSAAVFNLTGLVDMDVTPPGNITVIPNSAPIIYRLKINYHISGIGAEAAWFSPGEQVQIDITASDVPEWATVDFQPSQVTIDVSTLEPKTCNVLIFVDDTAPAQKNQNIKINLKSSTVRGLGAVIAEDTYSDEISFIPGYAPILKYSTMGPNSVRIGPMDNADFVVQLENLANAKSEVVFTVTGIPEGWTVSKPDVFTLGSNAYGEDPKGVVTISVQPPKGFGYHFEKQTIHLTLTVRYIQEGGGTATREYPLDLTVESVGFSIVGIEIPIIIILIIVLIIIAVIFFLRKFKK